MTKKATTTQRQQPQRGQTQQQQQPQDRQTTQNHNNFHLSFKLSGMENKYTNDNIDSKVAHTWAEFPSKGYQC